MNCVSVSVKTRLSFCYARVISTSGDLLRMLFLLHLKSRDKHEVVVLQSQLHRF